MTTIIFILLAIAAIIAVLNIREKRIGGATMNPQAVINLYKARPYLRDIFQQMATGDAEALQVLERLGILSLRYPHVDLNMFVQLSITGNKITLLYRAVGRDIMKLAAATSSRSELQKLLQHIERFQYNAVPNAPNVPPQSRITTMLSESEQAKVDEENRNARRALRNTNTAGTDNNQVNTTPPRKVSSVSVFADSFRPDESEVPNSSEEIQMSSLSPQELGNALYLLINGISTTLVANAPQEIHNKSAIEAEILFITVCQIIIEEDELYERLIVPVCTTFFEHTHNAGYNFSVQMLTDRMELYKNELMLTFNSDGNYYGGIIAYLLLENPLSTVIERSADVGSSLEMIVGIRAGMDELRKFIKVLSVPGPLRTEK